MRPHIWSNDCMMTWLHEILLDFLIWWKPPLFIDIRGSVMKGLMDWPTDRPSYRDTKRYLVNLIYLLGHLFARKCWFSLFPCVFQAILDVPHNGQLGSVFAKAIVRVPNWYPLSSKSRYMVSNFWLFWVQRQRRFAETVRLAAAVAETLGLQT